MRDGRGKKYFFLTVKHNIPKAYIVLFLFSSYYFVKEDDCVCFVEVGVLLFF